MTVTPDTYRRLHLNPKVLHVYLGPTLQERDAPGLRCLGTAVLHTFSAIVVDRAWLQVNPFCIELVHAINAIKRLSPEWPLASTVAIEWETLLKLGEALLAMSRDEQAFTFVQSDKRYARILLSLQEFEPSTSADLASRVELAPDVLRPLLSKMEEHALVSCLPISGRTMVWLGSSGHFALSKGVSL